jgi:hypothetical protein
MSKASERVADLLGTDDGFGVEPDCEDVAAIRRVLADRERMIAAIEVQRSNVWGGGAG